jgi:hypothetical protein
LLCERMKGTTVGRVHRERALESGAISELELKLFGMSERMVEGVEGVLGYWRETSW